MSNFKPQLQRPVWWFRLGFKATVRVGVKRVFVCVCVRTSDTCRTQQLHQGGAVTLCNLQHALDDAEEVGQETKTHLREKIPGV